MVPAVVVRMKTRLPRVTNSRPGDGSTDGVVPGAPGSARTMIVDWPGTRSTTTLTRSPFRSYAASRVTEPLHASRSHGTASGLVAVSQMSWVTRLSRRFSACRALAR